MEARPESQASDGGPRRVCLERICSGVSVSVSSDKRIGARRYQAARCEIRSERARSTICEEADLERDDASLSVECAVRSRCLSSDAVRRRVWMRACCRCVLVLLSLALSVVPRVSSRCVRVLLASAVCLITISSVLVPLAESVSHRRSTTDAPRPAASVEGSATARGRRGNATARPQHTRGQREDAGETKGRGGRMRARMTASPNETSLRRDFSRRKNRAVRHDAQQLRAWHAEAVAMEQ